jgi:hypothetical protein
MKWSVKLVAETAPGAITEHDLLTLERPDQLTLAAFQGLSSLKGKVRLAAQQRVAVLRAAAAEVKAVNRLKDLEHFGQKPFVHRFLDVGDVV